MRRTCTYLLYLVGWLLGAAVGLANSPDFATVATSGAWVMAMVGPLVIATEVDSLGMVLLAWMLTPCAAWTALALARELGTWLPQGYPVVLATTACLVAQWLLAPRPTLVGLLLWFGFTGCLGWMALNAARWAWSQLPIALLLTWGPLLLLPLPILKKLRRSA